MAFQEFFSTRGLGLPRNSKRRRTLSGDRGTKKSEGQLHLEGSNLCFSQQQLVTLNNHFSTIIDIEKKGDANIEECKALVTMERLIQRLVCGVGILDKRFASKFLVNLDTHHFTDSNLERKKLTYLVRLDMLSEPILYPEAEGSYLGGGACRPVETQDNCPQGFAKVRPTGPAIQKWAEFISPQGFIRRDKIQERYVELLAVSAARAGLVGNPCHLDESSVCASPGQIVYPETLHYILTRLPPDKQVFYGPAECHRSKFPDPRDFRIAIVEGCTCIRLRIGLSSEQCGVETDVQVTLVVGIGSSSWPCRSQFPGRIDLCHMEALLYYQAATTGFYLVPAPPHPTVRCEDRSCLWQMRMPAAEMTLMKHFSANSPPTRVLRVMRHLLGEVRVRGAATISDYMLRTLLWHRLEERGSSGAALMRSWTHHTLASHVLVLLDNLLIALQHQNLPSYFFPCFNVILNCAGGGTVHYTEEDYTHDGELVRRQLSALYQLAKRTGPSPTASARRLDCWYSMDTKLIERWTDVLAQLMPPPANRSTRLASPGKSTIAATQYSERQLEYIGHLLRSMLTVRSITYHKSSSVVDSHSTREATSQLEAEDLVFLISSVLEQAKASLQSRCTTSHTKLDSYHCSVNCLLEEVRCAECRSSSDLQDDSQVVRELLKWLYRGMDRQDLLGRILRPYLASLFLVSHEACWHLPEWNERVHNQEQAALSEFNALVLAGHVTPADALTDAYDKGWSWAESILEMSTLCAGGAELVYCPRAGRVVRHKISGTRRPQHPPSIVNPLHTFRRPHTNFPKPNYQSATLPRHVKPFGAECLARRLESGWRVSGEYDSQAKRAHGDMLHNMLRHSSPLSQTLEASHRYGNHRGIGNIVNALIRLRKFTVLQEVCGLLPPEDRFQLLDEIQRVARGCRRQFAGGRNVTKEKVEKAGTVTCASLVGTCRAARRRQHSNLTISHPDFFRRPLPLTSLPSNEMVHLSPQHHSERTMSNGKTKQPASIAL